MCAGRRGESVQRTQRSRGHCLGWRIHESVEDTKLSTNKQHSLLHRKTQVSFVRQPKEIDVDFQNRQKTRET